MNVRILTIFLITIGVAQRGMASEEDDFFEARVRPLLAKRCFECHRRKAEGGLRLDSLKAMLKGGDSGAAVVVGDAGSSMLWQVVSGKHKEISMPPGKALKQNEIKVLETWIASGARWPQATRHHRSGTSVLVVSADWQTDNSTDRRRLGATSD